MSMSKHMKRSGVVAWCPKPELASLIVCGTGAGSLGDFSASAPQVEVFSVSSSDPQDRTMPVLGAAEVTERFHSIAWGKGDAGTPCGLIAGGMANGSVTVLNAGAIVKGEDTAVLSATDKHVGPVQGLDFNPNQPNLLASGGAEAEIFIWDVSSPTTPKNYTPGTKVQQQTDITCVQWNPKVPHILASAAYNGVSVVWDLRAKRPVLTFTDPSRKQKCRSVAWNPVEPTQIVTASEEDTAPVISVWDLRNVYTPTKYLEGHTKGIWSVSWCPVDPGLLLSCGKHTEIFCWNMQTGKIQCEVETTNSWNSSVQWAPNLPSMFSVCSLEGQVKVFTLQDPTPRILGGGSTKHVDFSHPPKWLKKPVGASFGFGGKLFSFGSTQSSVNVRTLVTDPEFVTRAERLERAISSGEFKGFCDEKAHEVVNERDRQMWHLMKALFETDARTKLLAELDYDPEAVKNHIAEFLTSLPDQPDASAPGQPNAASPPSSKGKDKKEEDESEKEKEPEHVPEVFAEHEEKKELDGAEPEKEDEPIPFGNPAEANKGDDMSNLFGGDSGAGFSAGGENDPFNFGGAQSAAPDDPFSAIAVSQPVAREPENKAIGTHERKELAEKLADPIEFNTHSEDTESLVLRAIIVGNFALAVDLCIKSGRMAEALIIASYGGPELRTKTQDRYFNQNRAPFMRLVSSIVKDKLQELVAQTKLKSWKATLAVLCTYAKRDEFPVLCDFLGHRLEESGDADSAVLCYMCAGNIDKTVAAWAVQAGFDRQHKQSDDSFGLVELLEKVNIFRKAVDYNDITDVLATKYSQYAENLAAQGQLAAAMRYLSFLSDPKYNTLTGRKGAMLLDRVYHALGATGAAPPRPFTIEDVRPENLGYGQHQQQAPQQQYQQTPQAFGKPGASPYGGADQSRGPVGASMGGVGLQTPPRREAAPGPSPRGATSAGPQGGFGGQPSPLGGGGLSSPYGGAPSPLGGGGGVSPFPPTQHGFTGHSGMGHFGGQPSPLGGGGQPPPAHTPLGGHPSPFTSGGGAAPPLGGGGGHFGGQPSPLGGGAPLSHPPLGGQPSPLGGGQAPLSHPPLGGHPSPLSHPSQFGGAPSPLVSVGGSGGIPTPSGGRPVTTFPPNPHAPPPAGVVTTPAPGSGPLMTHPESHPVTPPHSATGLGVRTPPASVDNPPLEQPKAPSIPSNTHLKTKEDKPAGSGQPTALGTSVLNKFTGLIDNFSVQFASDPRKARAINDGKSRLEPLFVKLRNGELSAGAEGTLAELATALERGDKGLASNLHKEAAAKYWEELSSAVMIGMKRLIDSI